MSTIQAPRSILAVFLVALRLGLTSFGGPIAHIGYFRREYVERRGWVDEATFADLVALCQFLPGPASSQLGIAIGTRRAGILGGIAAWLGFTLPSAVALIALGMIAVRADLSGAGWVHGLKVAAVAVVAQAILLMARSLAPDARRRAIAIAALVAALLVATPLAQLGIIACSAIVGRLALPAAAVPKASRESARIGRRAGAVALVLFALLLVGLPLLRIPGGQPAALVDSFYRSGALVFGGGHVVLPLLHANVVGPGWVADDAFTAGYGAAQAVPGPLFTFAAYLGTVSSVPPNGIAGGLLALVAIFLPAFLLVFGTLPFWEALRSSAGFRRALLGINAAVVGILAAALYTPIWTSAIGDPADVVIAAGGLALLLTGRVPPIAVVALAAIAGQAGIA
ncbi:MAG TPA: chromate efflux transporter [Candidatus Limnocylindrales bacterium]|nr:chromate efflux transporter [Candidatus Limnocylindrales bacterium]